MVFSESPVWIETKVAINAFSVARAAREGAEELMIIGGAGLYREAMGRADRILLTRVHDVFDGDTFLPDIDPAEWMEVSRRRREADAANAVAMSFIELARRGSGGEA